MSRTVVSSRNTVYREQVILYSFIGVSMHTIARRVLEILSLRDHKREIWSILINEHEMDTFHLVAIGLKAAFSIEVTKIVCVYFVLVTRRTSLKFDHYYQKD